MVELVLRDLTRRYGDVVAANRVSLTVADGEFVTLLGPSGCGKSTTLAMIAGLDRPDEGFISVGGNVFFDGAKRRYVNAEDRNLGLVFQSYALWPHMTVRDNVAYALKLRRVPARKRQEAILDALRLVEMEAYIDRYPHQLSGGQQQRVALARTLAYRPSILLLDEPLSNLDAKLRDRARSWLRQLQSEVGISTIFVTHDQTEALSLSDRIAVMNRGHIVQIGTPREIYEAPADPFVADFVGSSNFLHGEVVSSSDEETMVRFADGQTWLTRTGKRLTPGEKASVFFRPERMTIGEAGQGGNVLSVDITGETYVGSRIHYTGQSAGGPIRFETLDPIGQRTATIRVDPDYCRVFAG